MQQEINVKKGVAELASSAKCPLINALTANTATVTVSIRTKKLFLDLNSAQEYCSEAFLGFLRCARGRRKMAAINLMYMNLLDAGHGVT